MKVRTYFTQPGESYSKALLPIHNGALVFALVVFNYFTLITFTGTISAPLQEFITEAPIKIKVNMQNNLI